MQYVVLIIREVELAHQGYTGAVLRRRCQQAAEIQSQGIPSEACFNQVQQRGLCAGVAAEVGKKPTVQLVKRRLKL